jgi:CBS domain containing-hemolysin-like protein
MEDLLYWLVGGLGVPVITALKGRWGLSGRPAMWLSAIVAALLAVIALLITHQISFSEFTPKEMFAAFGQVLAAATLAYKLLTE